jgi:hypothetical protein
MASALVMGDYAKVVDLAERRPREAAPDPWALYNLASALASLGRTDEAVAAFQRAEQAFGSAPDGLHGRAISIWGRARALDMAKECRHATAAYDEYTKLVGATDPEAGRLAASYAASCPAKGGGS